MHLPMPFRAKLDSCLDINAVCGFNLTIVKKKSLYALRSYRGIKQIH